MNTDKEWRVYCNGRWIGFARASSLDEAISKVKEKIKSQNKSIVGRWTAY